MIDSQTAQRVLDEALRRGGDLAELYLEDRTSLSLNLDDSRLEEAVQGNDRGAGIRVFYGPTAAYAYTDDLELESLLSTAKAAASAAKSSNESRVLDFTRSQSPLDFPVANLFDTMPVSEKAHLLHRLDQLARGYDSRVSQVQAGYSEYQRRVWVFNSAGL
ncbi:MAG: metalloprotease TldD, partial [Chloroflexi bacterium]|nr:metalloprotease TldD [Chloroflexota bacterium]